MRSRFRLLALPFALSLISACGNDAPPPAPAAPPAPPTATTGTATATPPPAPPPAPPTPPPAPEATTVGAALPAAEFVRAVLKLPLAADREGLKAISADSLSYQLVMPPEATPERVAAVAHALGDVPTTRVPWPATTNTFDIQVLAIHQASLLHERPATTAHAQAKLPDGSFFVAFLGTLTAGPSATTGEHAWIYGYTSSGLGGWVEAAHAVVESGCILPRASVAHALSLHAHDPQLDTLLLGNFQLHRDAHAHHGTFVVGDAFVASLRPHANCQRADLDLRIEVEGRPEEFHHALDREHGDTFFATAMPPENGDDASTWNLYPPRATEPAPPFTLRSGWTVPMRSRDHIHFGPTRGPGGAHGHWAYSVQHGRDPATFFTSDGTTFAEVPAEEAAPATP